MLELTVAQIRMNQQAVDKEAALQLVAEALEHDGRVGAGYLAGLQARETQGSTYLGQGIAIPHGTPQTRDQVLSTGVWNLHFAHGVDVGGGHRV